MADINSACSIFNGLSTAFFTFLLAVFGFLQWKAIDKQNKQNLFKLRIEHYVKYKNSLINMASSHIKENDSWILPKSSIKNIQQGIEMIIILAEESEFLFNKKISTLLNEFSKELVKIKKNLLKTSDKYINVDKNMTVLNEKGIEIDKEFSIFLSNLN